MGGLPPSSSDPCMTSIVGLPIIDDGEDEGVSIAGAVDKASLSDSMLALVPVPSPASAILDGVGGEGGEEGIESSVRAVRRLMVTLLDVGSGMRRPEGVWVGVRGGAISFSASVLCSSRRGVNGGRDSDSPTVSTDPLRESPRDTRRRLREEFSSCSNGFARVDEQGSEETARSRDCSAGSWSIWQALTRGNCERESRGAEARKQ